MQRLGMGAIQWLGLQVGPAGNGRLAWMAEVRVEGPAGKSSGPGVAPVPPPCCTELFCAVDVADRSSQTAVGISAGEAANG